MGVSELRLGCEMFVAPTIYHRNNEGLRTTKEDERMGVS